MSAASGAKELGDSDTRSSLGPLGRVNKYYEQVMMGPTRAEGSQGFTVTGSEKKSC